jgi:hypothetical protein
MILITYSIGQMKALGKRGGIKRKPYTLKTDTGNVRDIEERESKHVRGQANRGWPGRFWEAGTRGMADGVFTAEGAEKRMYRKGIGEEKNFYGIEAASAAGRAKS